MIVYHKVIGNNESSISISYHLLKEYSVFSTVLDFIYAFIQQISWLSFVY